MSGLLWRRGVSIGLVLCMIVATVSLVLLASPGQAVSYQSAFAYKEGDETGENFAKSVALMYLNDDDLADLVVGAPHSGPGGVADAGKIIVYLSIGGVPLSSTVEIQEKLSGDLLGWSVANAGDLNGDGFDDLAAGAPFADPSGRTDAGNVTIFFGGPGFGVRPNITIDGANAHESLGFALAPGGDINNDGYDDLIVGAPYFSSGTMSEVGRAYVFFGGATMDADPDKTFMGDTAGSHFGTSVAGGVSVDNDALLDIVVGAPDKPAAGAAYVIRNVNRANPTVNVVNGPAAGDLFGMSVAMLSDFNGDTFGDIAVGAPWHNNGSAVDSGEVAILYGGAKFNTGIDLALYGQAAGEWFGWAVAAGNVHEDRWTDLVVGAPNSTLNATLDGRAYVYFGSGAPTANPNITLVGDVGSNFFGGSLAIGGNLTGDIAPEFVVGDPTFNVVGHPNAGRAYVYAGEHVVVVVSENPIVRGYVRIPNTTEGLPGFTVTLDPLGKTTTTDLNGYFTITAVPGTYTLNATRTGYVGNTTTVTLAMNDVLTKYFYPLTVPIITGTITYSLTGLPISGATVAVYNGTAVLGTMTTPANGSYWMYLPEAYIPAEGASIDLVVKAWTASHYTSDPGQAISVARNQTKIANLALDRFPIILGTVRDAVTSSALEGAVVVADQGGTVRGTATTDNHGDYSFVAVNATAPATLYLNVTAPGYFHESATISVNKNNSYVQDFFMQVDDEPPTSSLAALPTYLTYDAFNLVATASDLNGIQKVQLWYRYDATGSYVLSGEDSTDPYIFLFNSTSARGDGLYEFYSIAVDFAGQQEAAPTGNDTWTIVDIQAPAVSITIPTMGVHLGETYVQLNWTASDATSGLDSYKVRLDTGSWVDGWANKSYRFTGVSEGAHTAYVNATDKAGLSATTSVGFVVDLTPPVVNITSPANNSKTNSMSVTITWNVTDALSSLQLLEVNADGGAWTNVLANATSHVFTGLAMGSHELFVRATDAALISATARVIVHVDLASPNVTITAPSASEKVKKTNVTVSWTMEDEGTGVASVEISVDGGAFQNLGIVDHTEVPNLADGQHTVTVRVIDEAGNYAEQNVTFEVSTEKPGVDMLTIGAIVGVLLVVLVVAALMMMRRRKGGPEQTTAPPKKPEK